jgi:hypothetical protein
VGSRLSEDQIVLHAGFRTSARRVASALVLGLTSLLGCSGSTERHEPSGGGSAGMTGSGGHAGITAITPGPGGNAGQGGMVNAELQPGSKLMGPAYFDLDCSPSGGLPEPDACAACEETTCRDELVKALGDGWTAGNANGPCAAWFSCIQACPCNDQSCYPSCISQLSEGACAAAFAPLDSCITGGCSKLCSASGTQ